MTDRAHELLTMRQSKSSSRFRSSFHFIFRQFKQCIAESMRYFIELYSSRKIITRSKLKWTLKVTAHGASTSSQINRMEREGSSRHFHASTPSKIKDAQSIPRGLMSLIRLPLMIDTPPLRPVMQVFRSCWRHNSALARCPS